MTDNRCPYPQCDFVGTEHCQRDDTHGDGWFDGFERMI